MDQRRIVVVADDGKPLSVPRQPTTTDLVEQGRHADLHYAYQWGEEAAKGDAGAELSALQARCPGDVEMQAEFDRGFAEATASIKRH